MCPIYTCPVYIITKKALKVDIHTQFTRQVTSLHILRQSFEQWRPRRRRLRLLCVLLSWSLWQLLRVVSELDIDVSYQHAKISGFGTTNWGFQGVCCLIERLVNHGHPKKTRNASGKLSGGVRVNQYLPPAISYSFHFRLYEVLCTNTSKNFTRFKCFESWNPVTLWLRQPTRCFKSRGQNSNTVLIFSLTHTHTHTHTNWSLIR
jgi:hypothetical protein